MNENWAVKGSIFRTILPKINSRKSRKENLMCDRKLGKPAVLHSENLFTDEERHTLRENLGGSTQDLGKAISDLITAVENVQDREDWIRGAKMALDFPNTAHISEIDEHVYQMIANDPLNTAEYANAYSALMEDNFTDELADAWFSLHCNLKTRQDIFLMGWPTCWDVKYVRPWIVLGGTALSVKTWHDAGWAVDDIFLEAEIIPGFRTSLRERVMNIDPSKFPIQLIGEEPEWKAS
jgi:hypothetical protein